jgi:hypothetical protein
MSNGCFSWSWIVAYILLLVNLSLVFYVFEQSHSTINCESSSSSSSSISGSISRSSSSNTHKNGFALSTTIETRDRPLALVDYAPKPIATIKSRASIGNVILEGEQLQIGAELGVYRGDFALNTLSKWKSCSKYVLVDLWGHQDNYADNSNKVDSGHQANYEYTMGRLGNFSHLLEVCRNYTTTCAERYPDEYFDFIYVDARHDYKGVLVDLHAWWPKLKVGGIIGGHDYVKQNDGPKQSGQDWTLNYDGTRDKLGRAVKGAVDEFAALVYRQVVVTYRDLHFNTWLMRK